MNKTHIHIVSEYKFHHIIKYMPVVFILFLLASVFTDAAAQENYEVRKITFRGNKTLGNSELLDHMVLQPSNFYKRVIQRKDASIYSSDFMESDIERLISYYQSQGFLHADVWLDSLHTDSKKHTVNIYVGVKENDPVKVNQVSFNITDSLPGINQRRGRRQLDRRMELKQGQRFTDQMVYNDVAKINNAFTNRGYVYVETDFDLDLKLPQDSVDIAYEVRPGLVGQFGSTTVTGNRYVKEKYIRKTLRYDEGERYSSGLLDDTRKNLYNLQLFRVVSIVPQINRQTQLNPIPVKIEIEEMPRWMSRFGLGWGTEDKFRTFADVTYRGLFNGTSRLNLYAKHSALTPYYISLTWTEPQFFVNKLSVSVNPYIRREREPGYDVQRLGVNLPVGYTFNDHMSASLSYYFERVKQFDVEGDPHVPNPEDKNFLYNKSGLSGTFTFNNAQPVFSPVRGAMVSVGGKVNGYIFGSDYNYTRFWVDARKYQRIGSFVLSLRAMGGGINSSDESGFIPVEDRFYSGGSNSNRGWARSMLGPGYNNENKNGEWTPSGGKSILEMNVELRHKLFWEVELAAFLDFGNVWSQSYHYRFNELSYATGGGLRVNTPIGPIRFDVGVPLGNVQPRKVQFFLSVGQAF